MNYSMRAFLLAMGALFLFSIMGVLVKYVQGRLSLWIVIFFRSLFSVIVLLPIVFRERPFLGYRKGLLLLRGLLGFGAIAGFFYTVSAIPLVDATLLFQASPLFIVILSNIFLKEEIQGREWGFMSIAFIGVSFVIKPTEGLFSPPAVIGLLGAFSAGAAHTVIRALGRTERTSVIVFYFVTFCLVATFPYMIVYGQTIALSTLMILIFIGIIGTFAQSMITTAYRLQKARKIAIIKYMGVPLAAWWGFLFWDEIPDGWTISGILLVIGSLLPMELMQEKSL